ncbi:RDD family protein [Clostridium sp.]|uniref:RDD family protein n=1 Tax=Clostridium sp. TaxID=1506 RepID=UPI003D6C81AD
MSYANFLKRISSYAMDYLIVSLPIMIVVGILCNLIFKNEINAQMFPFLLIILVYFPYGIFRNVYLDHTLYGDYRIIIVATLLIVLMETLMFTLMEILNDGHTIGKKKFKIKVVSESNKKYSLSIKIYRNILKSLSRNLFCIPFLFQLITSKKQTLYDSILGTSVIDR